MISLTVRSVDVGVWPEGSDNNGELYVGIAQDGMAVHATHPVKQKKSMSWNKEFLVYVYLVLTHCYPIS